MQILMQSVIENITKQNFDELVQSEVDILKEI